MLEKLDLGESSEDSNVANSVLSPRSDSALSPKLLGARSDALSELAQLKRSLREKEDKEDEAVRQMGIEKVRSSGPGSNSSSGAALPPPPAPPPAPPSTPGHDEDNREFYATTLRKADVTLDLDERSMRSPRAIITALTHRVKVLEAIPPSLPTAGSPPLFNPRRLTADLEHARASLGGERQRVKELEETVRGLNAKLFAEQRARQQVEVEMFTVREESTEVRLELKSAHQKLERVQDQARSDIEETKRQAEQMVEQTSKSHSDLAARAQEKRDEKHEELERVKSRHEREVADLTSELVKARDIAKNSSSTLKRHLDIALRNDEDLRNAHSELHGYKAQLESAHEEVHKHKSEKLQAESRAMISMSEVAAMREEVVKARKVQVAQILGPVKLENDRLKAKIEKLSLEKETVEEREASLQDHCVGMQEEISLYQHRVVKAEDHAQLLADRVKRLVADKKRLSKAVKEQKIYSTPSWVASAESSAAPLNGKVQLKRSLYTSYSITELDSKSRSSSPTGDPSVERAKRVALRGGSGPVSDGKVHIGQGKSAAQKAAARIHYPKVNVSKTSRVPSGTWRHGGAAVINPNSVNSKSPPDFNRAQYRKPAGGNKPWDPKPGSAVPQRASAGKRSPPEADGALNMWSENGMTSQKQGDVEFKAPQIDDISSVWEEQGASEFGYAQGNVPSSPTDSVEEMTQNNVTSLEELAKTLEIVKNLA